MKYPQNPAKSIAISQKNNQRDKLSQIPGAGKSKILQLF